MRKYQRLKSETKRMIRECGGGTGKKKDPTGLTDSWMPKPQSICFTVQ